MKRHELIGQRFGRLIVVERVTVSGPQRWMCRCDCGASYEAAGASLVSMHTSSCGCFRREQAAKLGRSSRNHGHAANGSMTPTYRAWVAMVQRCTNPRSRSYPDWGGRGIAVCDRWKEFSNFLSDMGERPVGPIRMTLERIDNDRGYEPGNCAWRGYKQQARNRRGNRTITIGGTSATVAEWLERSGMNKRTFYHRKRMGWSDDEALHIPSARISAAR